MTFPIQDAAFVGNLIPQKAPFVMVDSCHSFTDNALEAGLKVQADNIFSHDGFFTEPGLIEHMAQSVALHTGYKFYLMREDAPTGYIGAINSLEIHSLPPVSAEIRSQVSILQEFGGITLVDVATFYNGAEIARAQLKTVLAK